MTLQLRTCIISVEGNRNFTIGRQAYGYSDETVLTPKYQLNFIFSHPSKSDIIKDALVLAH